MRSRIMFLDIETAPNEVLSFSLENTERLSYKNILKDRYIICASWKFSNENHIYTSMISKPPNDKKVITDFSKAMLKADAVCAHNGDGFDLKFINGRLAFHGLDPLPKALTLDTYKMAKSNLLLNNYSLDYISRYFKLGSKLSPGLDVWKGCMQNNLKAKKEMAAYNIKDVILLEGAYYKLEPFAKHKMFLGNNACGRCSGPITKRGFTMTKTGQKQRFQCQQCGGWS